MEDWAQLFYPQGVPPEKMASLARVRKAFADAATVLVAELPEGRYKAMVKSKLEETAALATKSYTHR